MAWKLDVDLSQVSDMIDAMQGGVTPIARAALYEGAKVVADAMTGAIDNAKTQPFKYGTKGSLRYPTPEEINAVKASGWFIGVSKFDRNSGLATTSVGLNKAGYTDLMGRTVPVAVLVRSIESGTSFMRKQPVFRAAVNRVKGQAEDAIASEVQNRLDQLINK